MLRIFWSLSSTAFIQSCNSFNRLKEEAGILKSLNHSNIVGFRALMKSSDGSLCLALEHGEKSLLNLIEDRADQDHGKYF